MSSSCRYADVDATYRCRFEMTLQRSDKISRRVERGENRCRGRGDEDRGRCHDVTLMLAATTPMRPPRYYATPRRADAIAITDYATPRLMPAAIDAATTIPLFSHARHVGSERAVRTSATITKDDYFYSRFTRRCRARE